MQRAVLHLCPADKDALQAKLFLLLQTEQYGPALALIANSTSGDGLDCTFEKAYALYRLHREEEAATALNEIKGSDHRGVLHLEAQLVCTPTSSYEIGIVTCCARVIAKAPSSLVLTYTTSYLR